MKKTILIVMIVGFIMACNNENTDKSKGEKMDTKVEATTSNLTYPYKAEYSSDIKTGDAGHSKLVLDFYKCWEEGRIDDMSPLLADSVFIDFPEGGKFHGTRDSLIHFAKGVRGGYKKIEFKVDTWMPIHVNDKNEDYVLVWDREYETGQDNKVDSSGVHSYWQIKNNKISGWSEFRQALTEMRTETAKKK